VLVIQVVVYTKEGCHLCENVIASLKKMQERFASMRKIRTRFAKDLGLSDAVLLGIGFIIGSGIFLFPIIMAGQAGTNSLVSWIVAGVCSILTGLQNHEANQLKRPSSE
jgi:hypothetical protein